MATANLLQTSVSGGTQNALSLQGDGVFFPKASTTSRLALTLTTTDKGFIVYDTTDNNIYFWNGAAWESVPSSGDAGANGSVQYNDNGIVSGATNFVYDKATGNVGVGASPASYGGTFRTLAVNATDAGVLDLMSNSVSQFRIFGNGSENRLGGITNVPLTFYVNNSEAMRLNTTANLVLKGGTANANGVGVTFPATQVASSDANCLDDYEEGTFTPAIGGTATYTAQAGVYTKVGRLVTATFDITILLRGTGDSFAVSGLPFAASANAGAAVAVSYFSGLATSSASIYGYVNTSAMAFNLIAAGGGTSPSGAVVITNGTRLAGTAVYMV